MFVESGTRRLAVKAKLMSAKDYFRRDLILDDHGPFYKRHEVSQVRQSQMISLPSESCIDR